MFFNESLKGQPFNMIGDNVRNIWLTNDILDRNDPLVNKRTASLKLQEVLGSYIVSKD
jgi:hypothetical protein